MVVDAEVLPPSRRGLMSGGMTRPRRAADRVTSSPRCYAAVVVAERWCSRIEIPRAGGLTARECERADFHAACLAVAAQLAFLLAGVGHRGRNRLERLASAMRVTPIRSWKLVATKFKAMYGALRPLQPDRADWSPECLAIEDKRRAAEADDVAIEIRQEFIRDELQHPMRGLGIAVDRDGRLPLCKCWPLAAV
jgi:hypothetical protein